MTPTERTDWFVTYTGRRIFLCDPKVSDIALEDIAHSLALQCRYGGHIDTFYSVAEHCVRVAMSDNIPLDCKKEALLHDAAEAYLGDVKTPLKRMLREYNRLEALWMRAIRLRFGLVYDSAVEGAIKYADNIDLLVGKRDLIAPHEWPWLCGTESDYDPLPTGTLQPLDPPAAKSLFLSACQLFGVR